MKKVVRVSEENLVSIIKKIIKEDLEISNFKLKSSNGNIKVTDITTKKTLTYGLEAEVLGFRKSLYVNSINNDGITLNLVGTKPLNFEKLKKLLSNNFGAPEIVYTTKDGDIVYFVLKS